MQSLDTIVERQIVDLLSDLQGSRTDSEMAALLGCSRVHWWSVKKGRKALSYALAKRAGAHFDGVVRLLIRDIAAPAEKAS